MPHTLAEAERNRLLRRADWQFLLPARGPFRSVCFTQGVLWQAVSAISTDMADPHAVGEGSRDLAVAVNPNTRTLGAAWNALGAGGCLYTEWYWPLAGGPRGVRRRLEAAGFISTTCYWPWPWPAPTRTRFWVPLEAPGALRYFLASRPPGLGPSRLVRAVSRWLWMGLTFRVRPFPICAVSTKTGEGEHDRAAMPKALHTIQARWDSWDLGPSPERSSWLLLTGGPRTISKVVGLAVAEPSGAPRVAVKFARTPESAPLLRREEAALREVRARAPSVEGIPRVLFSEEQPSGYPAIAETALVGVPMYTHVRRDTFRALADQATEWQIALTTGRESRRDRWRDLIEPAVVEFAARYEPALRPGQLELATAALARLGPLLTVPEQRDFSPWNVLLSADGGLVVLDWESAEPNGAPALDLLYFMAHLGFFLDGVYSSREFARSYRTTLDPASFAGQVAQECVRRYASAVHLDSAALPALRVLTWIIHARAEHQRLTADLGATPDCRALRSTLCFSLFEESLASVPTLTGGTHESRTLRGRER